MKKSVSLSLFEATKESPVLFSSNIETNIPLIKEMGYDGVDLFVLDPKAKVSQQAIKLLKEYELGVGVVMPAALASEGLFLGHRDPDIRDEIVERMKEVMYYASEVEAMVSLGLVRGSVRGEEKVSDLLERFAETTNRLIPTSKEYGVDLVVEPINRYEINTLNNSMEAYQFIRDTGLPIGLMLDTFHMNLEDIDMHESFKVCGDLVKHVHFLDSNRLAPGMGHLDMRAIYKTLKDIDYKGYLCLEALQGDDFKHVAQKGIEFFKSIGL